MYLARSSLSAVVGIGLGLEQAGLFARTDWTVAFNERTTAKIGGGDTAPYKA